MDLETAIRTRRSIRAYRPDPVPGELIRQVLDAARWSPSWANTQCWEVYVVTGQALERIKTAHRQAGQNELPGAPDFRMPREWPAALEARRGALVTALTTAREGAGSPPPVPAMADLFGAPCLLLVAVDKSLVPDYACFDSGLFVQSLCLAAHDHRLGTCIMARAVRHPDLLRALLPAAANKRFVVGIALGYPDLDSPVNTFERPRAELHELVTWVE